MNGARQIRLVVFILVLSGLALGQACRRGGGGGGDGDLDADTGGDADMDVDVDIDADIDGDIDSDIDSDADTESDSDPDPDEEVPVPILAGTIRITERQEDGIYANTIDVSFVEAGGRECGVEREPSGPECVVIRTVSPLCDPPCIDPQVCGWSDRCEAICTAPDRGYSAGRVIVTGASHQHDITCTFAEESGEYTCDLIRDSDLWDVRDTLQAVAPGGDFPYFRADLLAPANVTMLTHLDDLSPSALSGAAPLPLEWYPGSGGVGINITAHLADRSVTLACETDDDGDFDVPAAGLAALSAGGSPARWTIEVVRTNQTVINEGRDGQLTFTAVGSGVNVTIEPETP